MGGGDRNGGVATIDPYLGITLGGFLIEGLIGQGAMGAVYRARQLSLDRPVALKVLASRLSMREDVLRRFLREARAAAAISHPHLIQIFAVGEEGGIYYQALELVEGKSLGDYLRAGEHFSESECLEIARQTLSAMREAHRAGVVHRDIKPDNLLLDSQHQIKLCDLGLARITEFESSVALTLTGVSVGTPLYMAPEQCMGKRSVDFRADFYGFGATLFHLSTGEPPHQGKTPLEVINMHINTPAPDARLINPLLTKSFAMLVRRLMAKRPEQRPKTHAEIARALDVCGARLALRSRDLMSQSRIAASQVVSPTFLDEPALWIGGATAACALVVAGILCMAILKGREPDNVLGFESRPEALGAEAGSADDAFLREVVALPPEEQVARVVSRLRELNPGYGGKVRHKIENGAVTEFSCESRFVSDISPVAALRGLRGFSCGGEAGEGGRSGLMDLSPLRGLSLARLSCGFSEVADLSPLDGMPLARVDCHAARVRDLSPVGGARLTYLNCGDNPQLADLGPLRGMRLLVLACQGTAVSDLRVLAEMPLKALQCDPAIIAEGYNRDLLRDIATLETVNGIPAAEFFAGR